MFHGRSRSSLGNKTDQDRRYRNSRTLQATRHRARPDVAARTRQYQMPFHDAEASRGPLRKSIDQTVGYHRRFLRRAKDDTPIFSVFRSIITSTALFSSPLFKAPVTSYSTH